MYINAEKLHKSCISRTVYQEVKDCQNDTDETFLQL